MSLKALVACFAQAAAAMSLAGCFLDGSHLPDSERLTVDGPVAAAPDEPPAPPAPASPPEPAPPTPLCVARWLAAPRTTPVGCPSRPPLRSDDADVGRASRESPRELIAALLQQPPAATARAFAVVGAVRSYERPHPGDTLRTIEAMLDALEPDPPRWRAAITSLAEVSSCALADDLAAAGGKMWARKEELRPAALYLVTAVFRRCGYRMARGTPATVEDLLRRFGAPFPPALLGSVLEEFPRAFELVPALWSSVREGGSPRRADVIVAHLPSILSRALGPWSCGPGDAGVFPDDRCAKDEVRRDLGAYIELLERAGDRHGLVLLQARLREMARDPAVDTTLGDLVEQLDSRLGRTKAR